jgi:hypothetical protein
MDTLQRLFKRQNQKPSEEELISKKLNNVIAKTEKKQQRKKEQMRENAYRAALKELERPEEVSRSNLNYLIQRRKEGNQSSLNLLQKYELSENPKNFYQTLPFGDWMKFQQNLRDKKILNKKINRNKRLQENQESYKAFLEKEKQFEEAMQEIRNPKNPINRSRAQTTASDPSSRPGSPFGGRRTRKQKHKHKRRQTRRKH